MTIIIRKKQRKYFIALVSSMVMLSLIIASAKVETTSSAQTNMAELMTIEFWHIQGTSQYWDISEAGQDWIFIQDSVNRFEIDHPGIDVNVITMVNDSYKVALAEALENGTLPCVFPTWGGGRLSELVQNSNIIDLTGLMNGNNYKDRFLPEALEYVTFNDKLWGVPVENVSATVVFYDQTIFYRYGLTPPQTFDELLYIIDTLVAAEITPFALANRTGWPGSFHYMYLVDRLGGPGVFEAAANRTGVSFEDPVFIEAGRLLQLLVTEGAFGPSNFNLLDHDEGEARQLLYDEQYPAAMELMGTWYLPVIKAEHLEYYLKLGFFPYPQIEGGRGDPNNIIGSIGDQFYHVSATCPYPQEAFEFIQYLIDDQAVTWREDEMRIAPVAGFNTDNPILQEVMGLVEAAPHIQLAYDQYLPPELGETHKEIVKRLLTLSITPEEAAREMEDAAIEYYANPNQ